jgi:uroporphyrin-3 C-methyltransferase
MSQIEKPTAVQEEVILDAEVLSEEGAAVHPSTLPKQIAAAIAGALLLGGIFWGVNQQLTQQLQQQATTATARGAENSAAIRTLEGNLGQLAGEIHSQREASDRFAATLKLQGQGFEALQTRLESSLQQQEQMIQQLIHSSREQSRQLSQSVAALARRVDRRESNLHTAAALRLLQIAEEQLLIVRDLESTQQALAQAGQQITATGDPILLPIHAQIQHELKQVRETRALDLPSALQQLRSAITLGTELPFNQPTEFQQQPAPSTLADGWSWQAILDKVWSDLLSLVRIDKQQSELPVIATRSEERLSRLILRLRLEQAQSALLLRDTPLFRERLTHALEWLPVFDTHSSAFSALQQQLESLQQLELQPQLPTIGEAHRRLRDIVAQRSSTRGDGEAAPGESRP